MRSRLRTLVIVVLLLAGIATLPALATTAGADPQTVTLATDDLTPFVTTHDGVKSGFTRIRPASPAELNGGFSDR